MEFEYDGVIAGRYAHAAKNPVGAEVLGGPAVDGGFPSRLIVDFGEDGKLFGG